MATAHPYKFVETVKIAINKDISTPKQISSLPNKKEKFDVLENNLKDLKKYVID